MLVDVVNHTVKQASLTLACHHDEEFHLSSRVRPVAGNNGTTTMGWCLQDALADFLVLVRDDEELYRLSLFAYDVVYNERRNDKDDIAIDDLLPVGKYQIAQRHNNKVDHHQDAAQRYVVVLVDHGCHNLRTTRTTVIGKS